MNHCPIVTERRRTQRNYGGNCKYGSKKDLMPYEKVGKNSACFLFSLSKEENRNTIEII